jgi:hypothetical protein
MAGFFKWRDHGACGVVLAGSVAAAIFAFNADVTTAQAGTAAGQLAQHIQIGKRLPTIGRLNADPAVLRTRAQMDAYQAAHPSLGLNRASGRPLIPMGMKAYKLAKQVAMQAASTGKPGASSMPPATATHRALAAAGPSQSDPGNGTFPPDTSVAVGSGNQIVAVVNSTFNVYNRSGHALLNESLNALIGSGGGMTQPRVLYDPVWNRWLVLVNSTPNASTPPAFWLAVSKTPSATGSYYIFYKQLTGRPNGDVMDYPMLGMTQDAVLFTGNYFSGGTTFTGSVVFGVSKALAYNGRGWAAPVAGTPVSSGTVVPPLVLDGSDKAFFMGVNTSSSTLDLYVGTDFGTTESVFTGYGPISVSGLTIPPNAAQYNATQVLETLDGRFEGPSTQYHSGSDVVLWNANTAGGGTYPIPHFYELDVTTSTVLQNVVFYDSATSYDFNPSIAVNTAGEALLNWSSTNPTAHQNARTLFSGWQPGDSTSFIGTGGVLTNGGPALKNNPEFSNVEYWGAYSAVALDPSAPSQCSFAANRRAVMINERTIDYQTWGTEFGIFGFC